MRIGIDAQAMMGVQTGLGTYTRNFIEALKKINSNHEFIFYEEKNGEMNTIKRLFWENVKRPRLAARDNLELFHMPAFAPSFHKNTKTVVTVHDLIGMLFPNNLGTASRFYWGKWLPARVQSADKIIADSEHTRKDILKHLKVSPEKVIVVYPSGHEGFRRIEDLNLISNIKAKYGIQNKYFLTVGTLEPRKNLKRIVQAFVNFSKEKTFQLVMVGSKNFAHGKVFQDLIRQFPMDSTKIIFTGYLEHAELNALYSGAEAFLFPSLYEGFGIPVLEAMASGAPVITSNSTSLPEVAGDAAILIDPEDPLALTQAMMTLSKWPQKAMDLKHKGFKRIHSFSWQKMTEQILKIYDSLA